MTYGSIIEWLKSHKITDNTKLQRELANRFNAVPGLTSEGTVRNVCYVIELDHPFDENSGVTHKDLERYLERNVTAV